MVDVPQDARALAVDAITLVLEDRAEDYVDGVTVSALRPEASLDPDLLPYCAVAIDGGAIEIAHTARPNIRATFWHHDTDAAFDLAALTFGLLMSAPLGALEQPAPVIAPYRDTDPVTKQAMASFTIQAAIPTASI